MKRLNRLLFSGIFIVVAVLPFQAKSQTLQPDYGAPANAVSVCDGSAAFKIKIVGSSQACASGTIDIELPTGYIYVSGSALVSDGSGTVSQVSATGSTARLQVNTIPASPGYTEITYQAYADCSAIGTATNVESLAKYTLSSPCLGTYAVTSNTFNTQTAALTISNITNGSFSGNIGGAFTRAISITNNGLGTVSQITFKDTIANGLTLQGYDLSSGWTATRSAVALGTDTVYTYLLTGPSLSQGQSVVLKENLKIVNSCNLQSRMYAYFGCSAVPCTDNNVTARASAGVSVNNSQAPNLVISGSQTQALACRGVDYEQVVQFSNTGSAALSNLQANIFSSGWSAVPGTQYFNPARSFTNGAQSGYSDIRYKIGSSGDWNTLPLDSVKSFSAPGSAIVGLPSSLYFTLPVINPGETVYVSYMERNSPLPGINAGNTMEVSGTEIWFSYEDGCGNRTAPVAQFLRNYVQLRINNEVDIPSNMEPGQSYSFSYAFTESNTGIYTYTSANGQSYIRFDLVLPANVSFTGNASSIKLMRSGSPVTSASIDSYSYNTATGTISIQYLVKSNFNISTFNGAILVYNDMQLNCAAASTGNNVVFNTYVKAKADCAYEEQMSTLSTKVGLLCPTLCGAAGGVSFQDFDFARTNYGNPDNNNDGKADYPGALDLNKLKTNYAMMGDTVMAVFNGKISVTASSPASGFTHGVAIDTFSAYGSYITGLYASVQLYAAGSGTPFYSCSSLPVNGGTTNYRSVYFSIDTLKKYCALPAGYTRYNNGDSLVVKIFYRVNNQVANALTTVDITNGLGVNTSLINTSALRAQYACGNRYTDRLVIVSKGTGNAHGNMTYSIQGNNTATLQGANVGYLGPCCTTAGSKPFVYEYRSVSIYDQVTFTVPDGYDFVSAKVRYLFTTYPSSSSYVDVAVTPVNSGAATLIFDTKTLFENGSLPYSDQGSAFYFYPVVRPNCAAQDKAVGTITIRQIATPGSSFTFASYTSVHADTIYLTRPNIKATVTNANVITNSSTVSWEVQIANPTSVSAASVWMAKNNTPSGVSISSIAKLTGPGGAISGAVTPDAGGIYKLGSFGQSSQYYRITATYSSCVKDSLQLAYWYDCSSAGYPASVTAQPYRETVDMYVQPQPPSLQLSIFSQPASATHDMCEQLDYGVEVLNAGAGDAGSPKVAVYLPSGGGLSYVAGTYQIEYPSGSNTYVTLSDANVVTGGSTIQFDIPSAYYTKLSTNEKVRIRYGLRTDCNFTSGQAIRVGASSVSPCGVVSSGITQQTEKIEMNGVPSTRNLYDLRSYVDTARQSCNSTADLTTSYRFVLVNQGPLLTSSSDLYSIELPANWTMDPGSISYLRNPSSAYYNNTNNGIYYFTTGAGLAVGDSIVMTATVQIAGTYAVSMMNGSTDPIRENATVLYSGTCSGGGSCPSSQAIVSSRAVTQIPYVNILAVNPNVYGTNNIWNGYMFQGTGYQTYKGKVTEGNTGSPNFDENFGGSAVNYATDVCSVYTENFSARYMLTKFFISGTYKMTVGGGDGYRFSVDGGNTWVIDQWSTHAYGTTDITLVLDGAYNMVIEYFGAVGANRVSYRLETLSVLSVGLQSFTGRLVNAEMKLNWGVGSGNKTSEFVVERASSNGVYTAIGTVSAAKNGTLSYEFTDPMPLQGRSTYRLRMTDENGKTVYSSVLPLVISGSADASLQVFPTVVTNQVFNIQAAKTMNNVKLTITDINGRLLKLVKLGRINANVKQVVEGEGSLRNSGIYTVFIEADEIANPVVRKLIVP
ncbi:MAG: hypothetical protein QM664_02720 [Flavihumibacter sp.]